MSRVPRILAIITIVAGAIMIVAGSTTYYLVQRELADEKIVVSDDAENFAGEPVEGPLTAYSEATVIKKHAAEIADGQTYAQLEQDDPRREIGDDLVVPPCRRCSPPSWPSACPASSSRSGCCSSSSASRSSRSTSR